MSLLAVFNRSDVEAEIANISDIVQGITFQSDVAFGKGLIATTWRGWSRISATSIRWWRSRSATSRRGRAASPDRRGWSWATATASTIALTSATSHVMSWKKNTVTIWILDTQRMDNSWSAIQVMDMIIKQTFLLVFRSSKYNERNKQMNINQPWWSYWY